MSIKHLTVRRGRDELVYEMDFDTEMPPPQVAVYAVEEGLLRLVLGHVRLEAGTLIGKKFTLEIE